MEVSKHEFARNDDRHEFDAHVFPDYTVQVDMNRKYVDASNSFCRVLGYSRKELIGERFDEVTAPRTNDIPVVFAFPAKTLRAWDLDSAKPLTFNKDCRSI
jgi:PAS domain S-box